MANYIFDNFYGKTSFEFGESSMRIREQAKNGEKEYRFKYADISKYSVAPLPYKGGSFYKLSFCSNGEKIERTENGSSKHVSVVTLQIKKAAADKSKLFNELDADNTNNIRSVIYKLTPLRSELDFIQERTKKITRLYENTPENEFGTVFIEGPRKNLNEYSVQLNSVTFFTMYTAMQEKNLREAGYYSESAARPYWADKKTLAFRIPYGRWNVGYTFETTDQSENLYTTGPKSVDIVVDAKHPKVRIRQKLGLFLNKLIEVK